MTTFGDIIGHWPSLREFADDIGVSYVTAQMMQFRDSINAEHWHRVVAAAEKRGFDGITLEVLQQLYADRKRRRKRSPKGNAPVVAA